ncbi:MAG: four helix bundle protein [Candidatus Tagabacteria bacterium CG09_land_8_20_14_0_10_41_14]|uniref:Four helix bundle protein n=2 Tax=Candidatus Tagaibacteriota TaxID=1817918 RepID=A0A2H0WM51_9BACT|nr:MAG: four helix bundle protein [Candidatus Tagabacteria bacterium CG09_land_8_20_14_0_10_41_14]PJE72899.1 MAG: four helix bundle protein [Candidatus Tagabacteria bacterium CG10_big_fil_rev_8_21_14_0_10_40_13]
MDYKDSLKIKMDDYVHFVYRITKLLPREEIYGIVSQISRAALSVILNYIEGYARRKPAVQLNFFEISYGSLKESEYLLRFSYEENYLSKDDYDLGSKMADEIGAMLYTEITNLEKKIKR